MKLSKALSKRLKTLREQAGLSQQQVAMRAELSLSLVAKLEQGKKADPRASTLLALAGALGVRPGALLDDLFPRELEPSADGETPLLRLEQNGTAEGDGVALEAALPKGVAVRPAKAKKGKEKARKKAKKKED